MTDTTYTLLSEDNQEKVKAYTECLLDLQRAEEAARAELEETKNTQRCSFCGKPQDKVPFLIIGKTGSICVDCLDVCKSFVERQPDLKKKK